MEGVIPDLLGNLHGTKVGSTHGTKVSHLRSFSGKGLVVKGASRFRIQREIELILPPKLEPCLREGIVPGLSARMSFGQVGGVSGNLIGNDSVLDVFFVGQAQMLFGSHVTEHGAAEPPDHGRTNGGGHVIIAWSDVGGEWTQGVKRCFKAFFQLFFHIDLDQMHGHVTRALDHDLHVVLPGDFGEFSQGFQFRELGFVVGIGDGTGS